jgi:hypothetical protein
MGGEGHGNKMRDGTETNTHLLEIKVPLLLQPLQVGRQLAHLPVQRRHRRAVVRARPGGVRAVPAHGRPAAGSCCGTRTYPPVEQ